MKPQLFQCFRFTETQRALDYMLALGFVEKLVVRDEDDQARITHAQLQWRDNGGVMFGPVMGDESDDRLRAGGHICNLVVHSDDAVDETFWRALDAGATVDAEPSHPPYGGRTASVLDFDGNVWSFSSYEGA